MECEEIRVDMRKMTADELAEGAKMTQLMFRLNHTMPRTPEYADILKELFGERLGEGSYVAAPIAGAALDMVKIGKLNYHQSDVNWANFAESVKWHCMYYGVPFYIKESLRKEVRQLETQ